MPCTSLHGARRDVQWLEGLPKHMENDLNLADLTKARDSAQEDLNLYRRMMSAEQRLADAQRALDNAQAAAEKEAVAEAKASYEAQWAGISSMRVALEGRTDANLLRKNYVVTYVKPQWNGFESVPCRYTGTISSLAHGELLYLIERAADQIPAPVLALAPGEPGKAVGLYLSAMRRGYL